MFNYKDLKPNTGYEMLDTRHNKTVYVVTPANYKGCISYCPIEYKGKLTTKKMFHMTISESEKIFTLLFNK